MHLFSKKLFTVESEIFENHENSVLGCIVLGCITLHVHFYLYYRILEKVVIFVLPRL